MNTQAASFVSRLPRLLALTAGYIFLAACTTSAPSTTVVSSITEIPHGDALRSIVQLRVKTGEQLSGTQIEERFEYGTGFFIDERGHILTCAHVIAMAEAPRSIQVLYQGRSFQPRVLRHDRKRDLALLFIDIEHSLPLPLADTPVRLGEQVYAVGFPYVRVFTDGLPTLTSGRIAGVERSIDWAGQPVDGLILTDAFVATGSSGGPLLREDGSVVGVLRFNLSRDDVWLGLSFAEPIASLGMLRGAPAP